MKIRTGDNVMVIAGKEKGKTGRVERHLPGEETLVIEGVNIVTRHMKPRPGIRQGGRIQKEAPIHVSNVVLVCNKCNRPTRPKTVFLDTGSRVRSCTKCQEVIDDAR